MPTVVALIGAIQSGDLATAGAALAQDPGLATERVSDGVCERSMLHFVTDWPGKRPNTAEMIALLVGHGADPNARCAGPHTETPLHWAASSDDVLAIDALLAAGADLEADGAVIGGLTPLADAVAFCQWNAAHRLVEAGAQVAFWQAAGLGLTDRVRATVAGESKRDISNAFWVAASGAQRSTADVLLAAGADINWVGHDDLTPRQVAAREGHNEIATWISELGGR